MQAVILAAGEGKRMRPLTLTRPKPMVEVAGKPLLAHIIDALPPEIDEVILVIGYKREAIREYFGNEYGGRRITYVEQTEPLGTGHALHLARPHIRGRFLFMFADDLHGPEDLAEALRHPLAILATRHEDPKRFGVIEVSEDGRLIGIEEKPAEPRSNLVSTGAMVLDERIFGYELERHENGEYYLTSPLARLAEEHPVMVVEQGFWVPLAYPEDVEAAERILAERAAVEGSSAA
ncbi:MAG: NTP transferase domain-containing protein [Patescibacteria group bacterium]|nr:NTP transferase domain-containing protein [Patescibacteria group bacterium]MDE1965675.1 NTP transferase domain-containing protein [Patescibacteria group bacterium]